MDDRFIFKPLPLAGLTMITRKVVSDHRGFLQRLYCKDVLESCGVLDPILQINFTLTHKLGAIRGMHFQEPPHAETKIISCIRGKIFDVAVDLRHDSPTFLRWHGEMLSSELNNSLVIPKGFAHGFQTLTSDCELLYFHTHTYQPHAESGISPFDTRLAISWPNEVTELSERDQSHAALTSDFQGVYA